MRITSRNFSYRLIALLCLAMGVLVVKVWQPADAPSMILVHAPPVGSKVDLFPDWPPISPAVLLEGRNLSDYEFGGEIDECSWRTEKASRPCLSRRQEAREFIYERFKAKKRAYIVFYFPCTDCVPVLHIFVEPDSSGVWRIVMRLEDARFGVFDREAAYDVRFRRSDADEREKERASRLLSFVDRSGIEIDAF
jgi:hypothetical protein